MRSARAHAPSLCALSVYAFAACTPIDPVTGMPIEDDGDHGGEIRMGRPSDSSGIATSSVGSETSAPGASTASTRRGTSTVVITSTLATPSPPVPTDDSPVLETQEGDASWYSDSLAGGPTAIGERYSPRALTAAHRRLPLGTWVRVTRRDTGASVVVRINDRGPFGNERRILDLSRRAAEELRMIRRGVAPIRLEVLRYGEGRPRRRPRRHR